MTLLGTLGQIALGLVGLDTPADIRDLTYDLTHWEWTPSHITQTLLDAIGLIPGIGVLKNADEAGALLKGLLNAAGTAEVVKNLVKYGDEAGTALLRHGDELGETLKKAAAAVLKTADDLPGDELAQQITKYWDEGAEAIATAAKKGADQADDLADTLSDAARGAGTIAEGGGNLLPNVEKVTVDMRKIIEYALNPQNTSGGANKARVFEGVLGYNQSNSDHLIQQIQAKLPTSKAILGTVDKYGQRFMVDIPITGPNGKTAIVRTGWLLEYGSEVPRMTTVFIK